MPSTPENVDTERLKRDIPKFLDNSRVITEQQRRWWSEFFEKSHQTYQSETPKSTTWLLDELKHLKTSSREGNRHENANEHLSAVPDLENAHNEITEIVNRQLGDIPEVI